MKNLKKLFAVVLLCMSFVALIGCGKDSSLKIFKFERSNGEVVYIFENLEFKSLKEVVKVGVMYKASFKRISVKPYLCIFDGNETVIKEVWDANTGDIINVKMIYVPNDRMWVFSIFDNLEDDSYNLELDDNSLASFEEISLEEFNNQK